MGIKAAGGQGVMKSGSLNLLDPSRPRRPVTGILYLFTLVKLK